jgi:hypothetical protein
LFTRFRNIVTFSLHWLSDLAYRPHSEKYTVGKGDTTRPLSVAAAAIEMKGRIFRREMTDEGASNEKGTALEAH